MRADKHRGAAAIAPNEFERAVVTGDTKSAASIFLGNGHAKRAQIKQAPYNPIWNFLLLINFN